MSNVTTVSYTNESLEQMRCSFCKLYLSCRPVQMFPDGSSACGRCNPFKLLPISQALPFEILLSQLSFPCQFKERGCPESILFDQAPEHESKCPYRSFACSSLVNTCGWDGPGTEIYAHVGQQHPELVKESAVFKFTRDQDTNKVFIVVKDDVVFTIKYSYNVDENCLKYDVRFFVNARKAEGMFKIQLSNNADSDCNFSLKSCKCLVYDDSFSNMENAAILNIGRYLEVLDNPTCIAVVINLKVVKSCNDSKVTSQTKVVDYELLESIRCTKCKKYLVPPLFDLDGTTICRNCAIHYSTEAPTRNAELLKLVSEINYPCEWHDCNYVGKSDAMQIHSLFCKFRNCSCFIQNCRVLFSVKTAAEHLQSHKNCEYLSGGTFKIIFSTSHRSRFLWTIKSGRLIVIQNYTAVSMCGAPKQVLLLLSDLIDFAVTIQFGHQHCGLKSELFHLSSNKAKSFEVDQFPVCFRKSNEELAVTIREYRCTPPTIEQLSIC